MSPDSEERYYLRDGSSAYYALESFGLGITNENLSKIPIGIEDRFDSWDSDEDGLSNKLEESIGTDPNNQDTDNDGYSDGAEVSGSYNPLGTGEIKIDTNLTEQLKGQILLQVESLGEAWYVNPDDSRRYYMHDGDAAYEIMRYLSLGITNADLDLIPTSSLSSVPGEADVPGSSGINEQETETYVNGQTPENDVEEEVEVEPEVEEEIEEFINTLNIDESTIDVLLVATEALETSPEFFDKVNEYIDTMADTEGLTTAYLELDSAVARDELDIYLADNEYTDWLLVKDAIERVVDEKNIEYLILLGGEEVVPMPVMDNVPNGTYDEENPIVDSVDGDSWYLDFNNDWLPDDGLVISRIADYGTGTTVILDYLDTAIKLHNLGGITMDSPAMLTGEGYCERYDEGIHGCYELPPYCVDSDPDCGCIEESMYDLLSSSDIIRFSGHGSRFGFVSEEGCLQFQVSKMENVNFNTHNPFVIGFYSCVTGIIFQTQQTNATEFLRSGASIFAGRTETLGLYQYFVDNFPEASMANRESVGQAFFDSIREPFISDPDFFLEIGYAVANQLILYGDPTLRLK